jgi:hypothetical protein
MYELFAFIAVFGSLALLAGLFVLTVWLLARKSGTWGTPKTSTFRRGRLKIKAWVRGDPTSRSEPPSKGE